MIATRAIPEGGINANKLATNLKTGLYTYKVFNDQPLVGVNTSPAYWVVPVGAGGTLNLARWSELQALIHIKGTQTLLTPLLDTANGLEVSQDQTDDDGVEYIFGGSLGAQNPYSYTCGTTPATFARLKFTIADVTGTDDCAFGFRKREASQANIDDYDEAAYLNAIAGNIKSETILNGAATTVSATLGTWADGAKKELMVVLRGRVASFYIDGAAKGGTFTFDSGEVLVPFFFFLQDAVAPGKLYFNEFEYGRLTDIDPEGLI